MNSFYIFIGKFFIITDPKSREDLERIHRETHGNTLYPDDWSHMTEKNFRTAE